MSKVSVIPDPAHPAGHALVRVAGAAPFASQPGFRVQRDAGWGDDKLGPGGWQSSDALLQPIRAEADGRDLLLHVGWDVCQHLEAGMYELSVPSADMEPAGAFWPEIVPMHSGPSHVPAPEPSRPLPVAEPDPAKAEVRAPPKPKLTPGPAMPLPTLDPPPPGPGALSGGGGAAVAAGVGLLVVLLVAAGVGYYALRDPAAPTDTQVAVRPATPSPFDSAPPSVEPSPPQPPSLPPPVPAAPGLGSMSVPDVIAKAPDTAAIRAEGEQRLSGDRKDDGLLLLEAAADRSDSAAMAAMARLYDPVVFQPGGPIPRADARQAARYYRDAARGGADVAAARDALRRLLQAQAQGGNMGADLMLKDFWP